MKKILPLLLLPLLFLVVAVCLLFPSEIFTLCCQIMDGCGKMLGLSYKEICVIGNVYVQGIVLLLSALAPSFIITRKCRKHPTFLVVFLLILSFLYSAVNIGGFCLMCYHYAMPLEEAFNLAVNELKLFGDFVFGIGYVGANLLIFVIGWSFLFFFNLVLSYLFSKKV